MVRWPKSVRGKVVTVALIPVVALATAALVVTLWGPILWIAVAVVTVPIVVLVRWRRHIEAARERAWSGEFSFGSVVVKMRAREAAQALAVEARRAQLLGTRYPVTVGAGAR